MVVVPKHISASLHYSPQHWWRPEKKKKEAKGLLFLDRKGRRPKGLIV